MTKNKGRGVFASSNFKKGDLLIVEKAIAVGNQTTHLVGHSFSDSSINDMSHTELVRECCAISN